MILKKKKQELALLQIHLTTAQKVLETELEK